MKKFTLKRFGFMAVAAGLCVVGTMAHAEGASAFDPAATATAATATVTTLATAIGGLLGAAALLYGGFLGYRKIREALNKA